jgi:hypothetical protein
MALFCVTGLSGTGKSAVLSELRVRGYHARGVDEDGYADASGPDASRGVFGPASGRIMQ